MGFSLTSPAPEKGDPTAEKRVWGFFGETQQSHRRNCPQPKQPRQGNRLTTTETASGRTYWPSRDPIGENGGINLYGMINNNMVVKFDVLGLIEGFPDVETAKRYYERIEKSFEKWKNENEDWSWLKGLPDCPCKINKVTYMSFCFQRRTDYSVSPLG